jgi:hypothetical protein
MGRPREAALDARFRQKPILIGAKRPAMGGGFHPVLIHFASAYRPPLGALPKTKPAVSSGQKMSP